MPQAGKQRLEEPQTKQEQSGQKKPEQSQLEKRRPEKSQPGTKQSIFSRLTLPELEMARDKLQLALEDSSKKPPTDPTNSSAITPQKLKGSKKSQAGSTNSGIITPQKLKSDSQKSRSSTKLIQTQLVELEVALHQRQRAIKAQVMNFEADNQQYLLLYTSTDGYYKMAGRSVLFYAARIVPRLGRRVTVRPDTDHYYPSGEGIVSIKNLVRLAEQLSQLGILPDPERSTSELYFYKFPYRLSGAQIAALRDKNEVVRQRLNQNLRPIGPIPELHYQLMMAFELCFNILRSTRGNAERELITDSLIHPLQAMLAAYNSYVGARPDFEFYYLPPTPTCWAQPMPTSPRAQILLGLIYHSCYLHDQAGFLDQVRVMHRTRLTRILQYNREIQRLAIAAYQELNQENNHE